MPELPEVETTVRMLRPRLEGRRVRSLRADARIVRRSSAPVARVRGARIEAVERLGKVIVLRLDGRAPGPDALAVHLGMTGWLRVVDVGRAGPGRAERHRHLVARLDDGSCLEFIDPRRFGYVHAGAYRDLARVLGVGPDALRVEPGELARRLATRRAAVKMLLLDQRIVSGVGNIYADEALFAARIDPRAPGAGAARHAAALVDAMRSVLRAAIARRGTTFRDFRTPSGEPGGYAARLAVYGRAGQPCSRCGRRVHRVILGGRSTHFCPACQRRGRTRISGGRGRSGADRSRRAIPRPAGCTR